MYEKLDKFLNVETWHSGHPFDQQRFFQALHSIVGEQDFNADQMAEYIRNKFGVPDGDDDHHLARSIEALQSDAWAVREYLKANNML